jgi:hypothetical protein
MICMKSTLIIVLSIFCSTAIGQTKDDLILNGPKDSVLTYPGEGFLATGNCLLIKFTGDSQKFLNELVAFHANEEDQVNRVENKMDIFMVSKPYWVLGTYSVHAELETRGTFTLVEIYFKAYNNPGRYKMHGADKAYQKIVDKILKK